MVNHKLRAARKAKAWTIEMAAEKIGVSPVTYGRWEKGTQTPYLPAVRDICKVFHKSPQDLGLDHLLEEPAEEETKNGTSPFVTQQLPTDHRLSAITLTQEEVALFYSLIGDDMKQFDPAKRETIEKVLKTVRIAAGASLLSPVQGLVQMGTLLHTEEILAVSGTNVPIFWRLYFDGHLAEVGQALPGYLSQLSSLAEEPSMYQKQAANLASKAHQLACMITLQPQDYASALIHADHALQYARVAEDPGLQVASLIRKALVYFYLKRPSQKLWAYQEAMQFSKSVSPLLQGRVYMGLAEAYSDLTRLDPTHETAALQFLERMYRTFPENPKGDQAFAFTHFKLPQGYEGVVYLNLNQPSKAWEALTQVDRNTPTLIVPDRVELTIRQAKASVALENLEQSKTYLERAVDSANRLGSQLRRNESYGVYQQMLNKWPNEQQVKDLAELFRL
jgi:DNA-binding XRE family transcriptional regulator/tetratricopeptide (TPR) repeat protein